MGFEGLGGLDGRRNEAGLLVSEGTVLRGMWVETGHGDARLRQPEGLGGCLCCDLDGFLEVFHREGVDGSAKGCVDRIQHNGELIVGQHHAHGRRLRWVCEVGQQLRVARPRMPRKVQGLFRNGCGHHRLDVAGHGV